MNRRGFTLTEFLMALSVMAMLGLALTRILISDSRFVSRQDAMLSARQGARAALNTIVSELSLVGDDAVTMATRDSFNVRVPYAFGVTCRTVPSTSTKVAALMPVDSLVWASMDSPNIYWRQRNGVYDRVTGVTVTTTTSASDSALCRADSVRVLSGGKLIRVTNLSSADSLAVLMLYERITYKFAASTDLPGRRGLWREMSGGTNEELVTPFDTSARFAYLMGGPNTATPTLRTTTVTGTGLDSIRGIELHLNAASVSAAQGTGAPQVFKLKTRIMFANKSGLP